MPKANGLKLLGAVRRNKRLTKLPFIMLTTRADKNSVLEAVESGVDAYVLKPFRFGALVDKVKEFLAEGYVQPPLARALVMVMPRGRLAQRW